MTLFTNEDIVHHATKAKVERIAESLAAEYPAITLEVQRNESGDTVKSIVAVWTDPETEERHIFANYDLKGVPSVGDAAADCQEAGFDPDAMEPNHAPSGSVVAEKYRRAYREQSSTGRSCGDWLAEWLAQETVNADNKTDMHTLEAIFTANKLDMSAKWANSSGSNGWQGRYRMNGRQVLEKAVAKSGVVFGTSGTVEVPTEALEALRAKHAKWLAKQDAAEAKAKADVEAVAKRLAEETFAKAK